MIECAGDENKEAANEKNVYNNTYFADYFYRVTNF